jgi:hypothetical protein
MYKFWATLFDTFHYYQSVDSEDGLQKLLDSINKVSFKSEAASKGTAFNELIDKAINDVSVYDRLRNYTAKELTYEFTDRDGSVSKIVFPTLIVKEFVEYFKGSVNQLYVEAKIETMLGDVLLYGYVDEIKRDWIYDIKTTGRYDLFKFADHYQHLVYPYCLEAQNMPIHNFRYYITDFKETFYEDYIFAPKRDIPRLKSACMEIIEFIERPEIKSKITNKKLFGNENT